MMRMQTVLHALFPPECLCCGARVETDFAICGPCWGDTPFIFGAACDHCGVGLPGQRAGAHDAPLVCEECHTTPRLWSRGRAVMAYGGNGKRLVLGLKHADRADIARAAGPWLARAGADLLGAADDALLIPIPLHWKRLAKRRFNQAALLTKALSDASGRAWLPDALLRPRCTGTQDGHDRAGRFANVDAAIVVSPARASRIAGRNIVLVDDVLTSGATFTAATEACLAAGAQQVCVIALARVARDG